MMDYCTVKLIVLLRSEIGGRRVSSQDTPRTLLLIEFTIRNTKLLSRGIILSAVMQI